MRILRIDTIWLGQSKFVYMQFKRRHFFNSMEMAKEKSKAKRRDQSDGNVVIDRTLYLFIESSLHTMIQYIYGDITHTQFDPASQINWQQWKI